MTPPLSDPVLDYPPRRGRGPNKASSQRVGAASPSKPARSSAKPKSPTAKAAAPQRAPRQRSREKWADPETELDAYRGMLESGNMSLVQLAPHIWVAEVYNISQDRRMMGNRAWTHISAIRNEAMGFEFNCSNCKQFKEHKCCIHTLLLERDAHNYLMFTQSYDPQCVMFWLHEPDEDNQPSTSIFSASRTQSGKRGERCFVTRTGTSVSGSAYNCSSCLHSTNCAHIILAKKTLRELDVLPESHGMRQGDGDEDEHREFAPPPNYADLRSQIDKADEKSVSHRPVGLPVWARTGSKDDEPAGAYAYKRPLPKELLLNGDARCRCGTLVDSSIPSEKMGCIVYDHAGAFAATIEVRRCTSCPTKSRMMAGPDLGDLGLFNFNNHTIVSHALLNKYDTLLSANESTFHGFCQVMEREYETCVSAEPFMGEDRFRTCWFSFMNLQSCGDAFCCNICGPTPRVVIVDGVTVGFQKRMQTSTLRPPTHTCAASATHDSVRVAKTPLQLVPDVQLRKQAIALIRWALPGGCAAVEGQDMSVDHDQVQKPKRGRKKKAKTSPSDPNGPPPFVIADVAAQLRKVNPILGDLFEQRVKPASNVLEEERLEHRQWLELLLQLAAHESILQFAPFRSWHELLTVDEGKERGAVIEACVHRLCATVPALGLVLQSGLEGRRRGEVENFENATAVVKLVLNHCMKAWGEVQRYDPEPVDAEKFKSEDWRETGCFYSMPQVRARPSYPGLANDGKIDRNMVSGTDGIGCNKFFAEYGKKGYTGGLLAFWCTHGICYGFHCIPDGEGRNDAFSALYTRWETAPRVVVYDFACALGPYCMLREAEFFKDTVFIIDRFHASGHKTCSPACFASNYAFDPDIKDANTSAAEFGNSGLKRIRLPVRYMSQRHAVVYIHRYLSLWNRLRRKKLARGTARRS